MMVKLTDISDLDDDFEWGCFLNVLIVQKTNISHLLDMKVDILCLLSLNSVFLPVWHSALCTNLAFLCPVILSLLSREYLLAFFWFLLIMSGHVEDNQVIVEWVQCLIRNCLSFLSHHDHLNIFHLYFKVCVYKHL